MPDAVFGGNVTGSSAGFGFHFSSKCAVDGRADEEDSTLSSTSTEPTILFMRDYCIARTLSQLSMMDAIYVSYDEYDHVIVYAVVNRADDAAYEALIEAEDYLAGRFANASIECRLRERQDRPVPAAVPVGSEPIWLR